MHPNEGNLTIQAYIRHVKLSIKVNLICDKENFTPGFEPETSRMIFNGLGGHKD